VTDYVTKDSGKREEYASGMRRDTQDGKPRYDLIDRAFLRRWADLMARGAEKYGDDNWRLADSEAELARFKASGLRHFMQWLEGEPDEDHAAAVAFNVAAAEYVRAKLDGNGVVGTVYGTPVKPSRQLHISLPTLYPEDSRGVIKAVDKDGPTDAVMYYIEWDHGREGWYVEKEFEEVT
jgi:hypothetical protein